MASTESQLQQFTAVGPLVVNGKLKLNENTI